MGWSRTSEASEHAHEQQYRPQKTEDESDGQAAVGIMPSALAHYHAWHKYAPSSKAIQPLLPCEPEELEGRVPLKELRLGHRTPDRLQIEPSFRRTHADVTRGLCSDLW